MNNNQVIQELNSKTYTFVQLFDKEYEGVDYIRIPIIQRDYAQGRTGVKEIRSEFVKSLKDKLILSESELTFPVDLDFIYGYTVIEDDVKHFYPLDGQQRLTTLFLLYWYIACKTGAFSEFSAIFEKNGKSAFTYQTRPSSEEFFDELVKEQFDISSLPSPSGCDTKDLLSSAIIEKGWFFLSWMHDPTINSALTMLDEIHEEFYNQNVTFDKLTNNRLPYITFQFLDLQYSGFSDDLYIKMNARGKPLSSFENFKAKLEGKIKKILTNGELFELHGRQVPLHTYFSHKIDTDWSDMFWHYRNTTSNDNNFDDEIMNFIRTFLTIYLPNGSSNANETLKLLFNSNQVFTYHTYNEHGCLTTSALSALMAVLDALCDGNQPIKKYLSSADYYNEEEMFISVINYSIADKRLSNEQSLQFFAYCLFLESHATEEISEENFNTWMRVIVNLTKNTRIEFDEFNKLLTTIRELATSADNILDYLVKNTGNIDKEEEDDARNKFKGFNKQQVREERIKAILIRKSDDWKMFILKVERHGYFDGQIEFILKFAGVLDYYFQHGHCSWSDNENVDFFKNCVNYYLKASMIFDENGLMPILSGPYGRPHSEIGSDGISEFIFERALLVIGDYLLDISYDRKSFLDNNTRDYSWKRLLSGSGFLSDSNIDDKRNYLKILLDAIDGDNIVEALSQIVKTNVDALEEWRMLFIEEPRLIQKCAERRISVNDQTEPKNDIFLLDKKTINSQHVEAYSYRLLLSMLDATLDIIPFAEVKEYSTGSFFERPFIYFNGWTTGDNKIDLDIVFEINCWRIVLSPQEETTIPEALASIMIAELKFEGPEENADDSNVISRKNIPKDEIKNVLIEILDKLKTYDTNNSSSPEKLGDN